MIIRIAGAILILFGCGYMGYSLTSTHKKTTKDMQDLIAALEYIECELQYRQLPLQDVFKRAATDDGVIKEFFEIFSEELEGQIAPNVECCMAAALGKIRDLPNLVKVAIGKLSRCLGHFELEGQITGLRSVREECKIMLSNHVNNQETRVRNYHTLALCAGAALVIIFL